MCSLRFQTCQGFAPGQSLRQSRHKPASSEVTKSRASSFASSELSSQRIFPSPWEEVKSHRGHGLLSAGILLCLGTESLGVPIRTRPWEYNTGASVSSDFCYVTCPQDNEMMNTECPSCLAVRRHNKKKTAWSCSPSSLCDHGYMVSFCVSSLLNLSHLSP